MSIAIGPAPAASAATTAGSASGVSVSGGQAVAQLQGRQRRGVDVLGHPVDDARLSHGPTVPACATHDVPGARQHRRA